MPVQTGVGFDWDLKRRVGICAVDKGLDPRERALELTTAASAIRSTRGSGGREMDNATARSAVFVPQVGTILTEGGVPVSESCRTIREGTITVVAKATVS